MSEVRLIDANALKEEVNKKNVVGRFNMLLLIDNAPTVELFCFYLSDGEVRQPCVEAPCKHERPQGEYKTACNVLLSLEQIVRRSDGWEDSAIEAIHNAIQTAIKALEFAESQRLCCENCVNRNYKSKEVCTSPYGVCEFFDDKTQKHGAE